jgi:hypothetical protein
MDDTEFLAAFHDGSLAGSEFKHRGHLRLAWLVLNRHSSEEAARILSREIQRFATSHGEPGRYHETLTRFWVHLVSHAMSEAPHVRGIDELVDRFPILLEKDLPYRHWTHTTFDSQDARAGWVSPDLSPLP